MGCTGACLRQGIAWTAEGEAAWKDEVYAFYGDGSKEELGLHPCQLGAGRG